jgi:hypothetical protein
MSKKLKDLKKRFKDTLQNVADMLGVHPATVKRDEYVRLTVDTGMEDKLNKEELNLLGGFKEIKKISFKKPKLAHVPKVLIFDIETSPIEAYVWRLFDQNVSLNQIIKDWYVLSWSAKWLGDSADKVMYEDQRHAKDLANDKKIMKSIHKLLDEADVVITQNGIKFDVKKLNSRFIMHGMKPPRSFKHIDTLRIARRHFSFTSNKLEYMTDKLCTVYKKLTHGKFPGFALWKECLAGNMEAWDEMEEYNRYDVLSLEELYHKLIPWDNTVDFNLFTSDDADYVCSCGSTRFDRKEGDYYHTTAARYQRVVCKDCGKQTRDSENLLTKVKKKKLRKRAVR